jgi:hypothetical protein
MWVTRIDTNQWEIELRDQPLRVAEYQNLTKTTKRGGGSCGTAITGYVTAQPINATFRFTRTLQ